METWFSLPNLKTLGPPPRWKMAIVSFIGAYSISLLAQHILGLYLGQSPLLTNTLMTIILVLGLTYFAMPLLSRLLRRWLYPRNVWLVLSCSFINKFLKVLYFVSATCSACITTNNHFGLLDSQYDYLRDNNACLGRLENCDNILSPVCVCSSARMTRDFWFSLSNHAMRLAHIGRTSIFWHKYASSCDNWGNNVVQTWYLVTLRIHLNIK